MRSLRTASLALLVLAGLTPRVSHAQVSPPQTPPAKSVPLGGLIRNWPNPMNPETHIVFAIGDYPACSLSGHRYAVSLKIYNTVNQPTAIPVLETSGSVVGGQQTDKLSLPCGLYQAYWNGKILGTRKEAPSGVYMYVLVIDGHEFVKKMNVVK